MTTTISPEIDLTVWPLLHSYYVENKTLRSIANELDITFRQVHHQLVRERGELNRARITLGLPIVSNWAKKPKSIPEHGTYARYSKGCECALCKATGYEMRTIHEMEYRTRNPIKHRLYAIKDRAAKRLIEFDLDEEYLIKIWKKRCAYCRKQFKSKRSDSPTIDRIIPSLGYVKGNIAVVCGECNRRKQDQSPDEMQRLVESIKEYQLFIRGPDVYIGITK